MAQRIFLAFILCFNFSVGFCGEAAKAVLVTGGAGYIGTQTCKALTDAGFFPIVYDNLSVGHQEGLKWGVLVRGDLFDRKKLIEAIDKYHPVAVVHVAAFKAVGESVKDPAKYYMNNVCGSLQLLDVMREKGVKKIIFSSTAATYGSPSKLEPIVETDPCQPINPYGTSKWMVEKILEDFRHAYGIEFVALRYFNVAGADLKGECGERGSSPQNLVPIVLQVAAEKRKELEIFGKDYPTEDGTAIRDYIHVVDIADAHVKGLQYLLEGKPSVILNLGTGKGASVQQVVDLARKITHKAIPVKEAPRRAGDPAILTADAHRAKELLGWEPKHSDLETIIESEWKWSQSLQNAH
ncbi:MAG: UDP-glucose 4-epimerase GalE [Verrucomicrobia bacterium]|nr:UDP-glucose 4-epimerase GalE [Verrucomicrobiota bacterium]